MEQLDDDDEPLETGWMLEGGESSAQPVRLVFGETELVRAYLGVVVGRHPALCERVVPEESVSRRHFRIGFTDGAPFVEDLNSLNGTAVDGVDLAPFRPTPLAPGQTLRCGRLELTLRRLGEPPRGR